MSKLEISKRTDEVFGNIAYITNGIIELEASLDFGPRIMRYNLVGKENMFHNDREKKPLLEEGLPEFDGEVVTVYGGHRLWVSPEILPRCYYPDNYPVELTETETGIILDAPVEKFNNIRKSMEVRINEHSSQVKIINTVYNCGAWDIVLAPWSITVMAQGGVEVLPQADRDTGFLNNRFIGLWPYTKLTDSRVYWGDEYIVLKQDTSVDAKFKIGTNNEKGWVAYFNRGQLFIKSYSHVVDGFYPDFAGCSFETYTDKSVLELEALGQIGIVQPGGSVSLKEKWTLFSEDFMPGKDEEKIAEIMESYIQ